MLTFIDGTRRTAQWRHRPNSTCHANAVEQRISLVTLGVADLPRARMFYERLGWRGQEVEETVFFQAGGMALVLWSADKLAEDTGIDTAMGAGFRGMTLAHNVRSREEVDGVLSVADSAGGTITRPAGDTFYGGYAHPPLETLWRRVAERGLEDPPITPKNLETWYASFERPDASEIARYDGFTLLQA